MSQKPSPSTSPRTRPGVFKPKLSPTQVSAHHALASAALVLGMGLSGTASGAWVDGQAATIVLGAPNFTTAGEGASASRFLGPTDICTDLATGKVFVIAYRQHRILRFSAAEAVKAADGTAEAVFGQPDFTSTAENNGGQSAKSLKQPMTCAVDSAGRLFVTDSGNRRVLRYDNAATKPSFSDADGVLGQADFVTLTTDTTANRFGAGNQYGIALASNGSLFVSDSGNQRVLRFDNAAGKSNGAAADGVLGAPDLTTAGAGGTSATTFSNLIYGLTLDAQGNLYASDGGNARILRFNSAVAKANGAAADGVLGAADLTTAGAGAASASRLSNSVYGIDVLADGALYVADFAYNRVLVFNAPATKANGAAADHVLGQPGFTTTSAGLTAQGLNSPLGLGFNAHAGYLMIPDFNGSRVVGHYQASLLANADGVCGSVAATSFQPSAGLCSSGTLSVAGVLQGSSGWTWGCDGAGTGTSTAPNACSASYGATGTGSGAAGSSVSGGSWVFAPAGTSATQTGGFIPSTGHPKSPPTLPPGYTFPHGLFDFVLTSGTPGSSATVTLTFPSAFPSGTVWWKYGATASNPTPHWYQFPGAAITGNTVTLTLTDDADGDDAYTTAGLIADPGGPGLPLAATTVAPIPTLSEWALILLSGLVGLFAFSRLNRRPARPAA